MSKVQHPSDTDRKIIIDWLSLTCSGDPYGLISFLGLDGFEFELVNGAKGFSKRLYFEGVSIHHGHRLNPDLLWLEMSGQGCRFFETFGLGFFDPLFQWILGNKEAVHVTRLDVAFDDFDDDEGKHLLDMDQIAEDTRLGFYVYRGQYWEVIQSSQGTSVMFGSPQSEIRIRIYDKAAERKCDEGFHWVRVELQLRRDRAFNFIDKLYDPPLDDFGNVPEAWGIGDCFCGVIHRYLWFAERTEDTNKSRWHIAMYWAAFLAGACKLKIATNPGIEYNLLRCKHYVFNMAGNAVDALIKILGYETFIDELGQRKIKQNPKYRQLVFENGGIIDL